MRERGLSNSVQMALLLPLALSLLLGTLQWAMVAWADATAVGAVEETLHAAAGRGGDLDQARAAGHAAADNGALHEVTVMVTDSGDRVVATVTGRANVILWPITVAQSGERAPERVR